MPPPFQPLLEVMPVNRSLTVHHARTLWGLLMVALLTATLLPRTSWSQESDPPVNAEARTQFGEQLDVAKVLVEVGDAENLVQAGETFLQAAETAKNSGDAELSALTTNTQENALKAFMDAGTAYSTAENHEASAAQFVRAAEVAIMLEDAGLQAKALSNASVSHLKSQNANEEAVRTIREAAQLVPDDLTYQYTLGVVLRSTDDVEGAIEAFMVLNEKATGAGDEAMAAKAHENIGKIHLVAAQTALKDKNYQQAIDAVDEAAQYLGEDDGTVQTFYANAYYQLGVQQVKAEQWNTAQTTLGKAKEHAGKANKPKIAEGAQAQLDYIKQVKESQQ